MRENLVESKLIHLQPNLLWFITLAFTMVIVLSNWFDARLVRIFGLDTDAGTLIFPLTFLLSNLITEVYGYKYARRAIWCGFLFNALFIVYGQIVIHMPSPEYAKHNAVFDTLLAVNTRIILASAVSYLCSEPLNSLVMAKLKIRMEGRYLPVRLVASTVLAAGVDSFIFSLIGFYGVMSGDRLVVFGFTMWMIKVVIEVLGVPVSVRVVNGLKRIEGMDVFDRRTRFNLFSLDVDYVNDDNEYVRGKKSV